MRITKKLRLKLDGLDCAACAAKIEAVVQKLPGVTGATLDFVGSRMQVEIADDADAEDIYAKIRAIVMRMEHGVLVTAEEQPGDDREKQNAGFRAEFRKQLAKIIIGGVIFAVAEAGAFGADTETILYLISYIIIGGGVVLSAVKGLFGRQIFNEYFLMSIASIGAFLVGEHPEGVAVMLFYQIGELLQERAVDHSRRSISALMQIKPEYANLQQGGRLVEVSPEQVKAGDLIVIKPGEKVPLDGMIIEGDSTADTSALTGESAPRELHPGQEILSGIINGGGLLTVKVTKEYAQSTVAQILELTQNVSARKAPTEKFISKFARYYTPLVVFGAVALALIPTLFVPGASFADWGYRALVFLVISCPCALVISIPLGFYGGIGCASRRGILIKGSNYLEALNKLETVVFDKTGTLTKGVFTVEAINPQNGFGREQLLYFAAYAESFSNHPVARSLCNAYAAEIDQGKIENYQEIAGMGVKAEIDRRAVIAGNARLMDSEQIRHTTPVTVGSVIHLAVDGEYAGNIVISDQIKEDAAAAVSELKRLGVKITVMLSGDNKKTGEYIGSRLGIDVVYTDLLPADKVAKLEALERSKTPGGRVAFVGDGLNDAPALARADIGIAMGGLGAAAAIEAADIVIMNDQPSKIYTAFKIAKKTGGIVYQNIALALGIKAIILLLGAFGLATMWMAVFGDVGVLMIAVLNSLRATRINDV